MNRIEGNLIILDDVSSFVPKHIFECGQVFRYTKIDDNTYTICSYTHYAIVRDKTDIIKIECDDPLYFWHYFDLDNDYTALKNKINSDGVLSEAIEHGRGIRILKQNLFETLISFIISANNNISRIRKSLDYICCKLGKNLGSHYTFPSLDALASVDQEFFVAAGVGYRAPYLVDTIYKIKNNQFDLEELKTLPTKEAKAKLLTLKGVGEKVANCVLLFSLGKGDVFPVDTWIEKVYNDYFFEGKKSPKQITTFLEDKFKENSGLVQQYLFYYKRNKM